MLYSSAAFVEHVSKGHFLSLFLLLFFLFYFIFLLISQSLSFPNTTLTNNRLASIMQSHNSGRGEASRGGARNVNRNKGDGERKNREVEVRREW